MSDACYHYDRTTEITIHSKKAPDFRTSPNNTPAFHLQFRKRIAPKFHFTHTISVQPQPHKQQNNTQRTMETIKNAANYVSESVQSTFATGSKEANKEVAKDSDQSIGTRLNAGIDAAKDKMDESSHDAKAEAYKQKATH
ncbi:hypothetical protein PROFUN_11966 [Planoprotostelium fungivorum]|uniref:Glucose-repressible protein n=1 Tax=Planoprotostelium fungivorum TaxID=1890364 RepID=A0A2P6N908_9EUKA|nr:hypothetical protein PROFUN_11966 [Planoprotostelium fungivorum]